MLHLSKQQHSTKRATTAGMVLTSPSTIVFLATVPSSFACRAACLADELSSSALSRSSSFMRSALMESIFLWCSLLYRELTVTAATPCKQRGKLA